MEKAKGILQFLNGGRWEEVEEGLKEPWKMQSRLCEEGNVLGWGSLPPG